MMKTTKPAFVNIFWPDIEESRLNYFCMCKLIHFDCSLIPHSKGEPMVKGKVCPYCHMEFLNALPDSDSRFRSGSRLRFRYGS